MDGCDVAAAEISNQYRVTKFPKIAARDRNTPWCVEPGTIFQPLQQFAARAEYIYISKSRPMPLLFPACVAASVGHVNVLANILDVERAKFVRNLRIAECLFGKMYRLKIGVENFYFTREEIGRI